MSKNVKVPKRIGESIEALRAKDWTDLQLIELSSYIQDHGAVIPSLIMNRKCIAEWLASDLESNFPTLVEAVLNGYEIEEPEDVILSEIDEMIEKAKEKKKGAISGSEYYWYLDGKIDALYKIRLMIRRAKLTVADER